MLSLRKQKGGYMTAKVVVRSKTTEYEFSLKLHRANQPSEQQIEAEFYAQYSLEHKVPEGPHIECEVISPTLWSHPMHKKIHIHRSNKTGGWYVCWTNPLPDETAALHLLEMWCAGTVYTMESGNGFETLLSPDELMGSDFHKALIKLSNEFSIGVTQLCIN